MTRNNNTYRLKGRAVFLAAIMVISMLALPVAFTGVAAADESGEIEEDFHEEVTDGQTKYQGQILAADVSDIPGGEDEIELRSYDSSDRQVGGLEEDLSFDDGPENENWVVFDTEDLEDGNYIITDNSSGDDRGDNDIRFELVEQALTVEFDDDTVADAGGDANTELEVSSRQRSTYAINVSADGLDDTDLRDIFTDGPDIDPKSDEFIGEDRSGEHDNQFDIAENASRDADAGFAMIDDDDEVLTILGGENDFDLNFTGVDEDDYEFNVEVVDSTAEDSDSVTVEDRGDGDADVNDVDVSQGNIAAFEVELDNTDDAALVIGNEDDDGYQANVSITDADEDTVTVYFNTYTAGNENVDADDIVFADDDEADVELKNAGEDFEKLSSILDTGDYEVVAGAADTSTPSEIDFEEIVDDPDNIATLTINERTDIDATQWRAGAAAIDDVTDELTDEDEEAAVELIGEVVDDLITETDMFAVDEEDGDRSDYQIHQITADGLEGLIANNTDESSQLDADEDRTESFYQTLRQENSVGDDNATLFELEQLDPGSNQDAIEVDFATIDEGDFTDIATVIYDGESDDYYVIIDTDELIEEVDDMEEDQEYEVTFALQDDRLLDEDDEDDLEDLYEEVNWEFELEEAEGDYLNMNDDDLVEAETSEEAELQVETNVAPGTELDIRARNAQGTSPSFINTDRDVVVDVDGVATGEFDFSAQSVDDEFETEVRQAAFEVDEDGIFVDAVEDEPVEDDEDDVVDDEDDVVDDEDDVVDDEDDVVDDEDDAVDDVDDETPGFGAIVALVALIGAALLAVRRQN